jgi:hypothetical protein
MIKSNKGSFLRTCIELSIGVKEEKIMGKKKFLFVFVICVFILIFMLPFATVKYEEWKKDHSGIPDLISSSSMNRDYSLTIAANSSSVDDKEKFAREIIRMCQENSFRTVRFSTDLEGYPSSLDIDVYLMEKDIDSEEPFFQIRFTPIEFDKGYDIKNNADKYRLYIDGKEIS